MPSVFDHLGSSRGVRLVVADVTRVPENAPVRVDIGDGLEEDVTWPQSLGVEPAVGQRVLVAFGVAARSPVRPPVIAVY